MVKYILLLTLLLFPSAVKGNDYSLPSRSQYFQSLMMPDNPTTSCCRAGDAYFADETRPCNPIDLKINPKCRLVAIITDTRIDKINYKGKEFIVPINKLRIPPIPNPTNHNIVFTNPYNYNINNTYCWEPKERV